MKLTQNPITLQMIWKRAQKHKRRIIEKETNGLKRVSGFFFEYCSDRPKCNINNDSIASFVQKCTFDHIRTLIPASRLQSVNNTYALYSKKENIVSDLVVNNSMMMCDILIDDVKKSISVDARMLQDDICSVLSCSLEEILFVLIYLHFNRSQGSKFDTFWTTT